VQFLRSALWPIPRQAIAEAKRCGGLPQAICVPGAGQRGYSGLPKLVARGDLIGAATLIRKTNALPAITGRVCPQEIPVEGVCRWPNAMSRIAIAAWKRFVADWEAAAAYSVCLFSAATHKKVAVVGSGPAGLTGPPTCRFGHNE